MVRRLAKHPVVTLQSVAASTVEPTAQPNAKPGSSVVENRFVAVQNPRARGAQRPRRAAGYQRRNVHSLGPPQEVIRLTPEQPLWQSATRFENPAVGLNADVVPVPRFLLDDDLFLYGSGGPGPFFGRGQRRAADRSQQNRDTY